MSIRGFHIVFVALSTLLAINTDEGDAYSPAQISRWLSDAGWSRVRPVDLGDDGYYAFLAVKD